MYANYNVAYSKKFQRIFEKLTVLEKKIVMVKINVLETNPFHSSLRTKKLRSNPNLYESSINMDIRIIWQFEENRIIMILTVGHHDILKEY